MSFRGWVILVALLLGAAGGILLFLSAQTPEWIDSARANALFLTEPPDLKGAAYDAFMSRWYTNLEAVRTQKWLMFDLGAGLITFAVCLLLALTRIEDWADIVALKTPRNGLTIAGAATIAWFGGYAGSVRSVWLGMERQEYAYWEDSIAIPLFGLSVFWLVGWAFMALGLWLFILRRAHLPVSLWIWPSGAPVANGLYAGLTAISILAALSMIHDGLTHGPYFLIPPALLWIYATLVVRAAAISRLPSNCSTRTL